MFAVEHFGVYLLGSKFLLLTDYNAFRRLHLTEPDGRVERWMIDLEQYDFEVKQL